MHKPRLRILLVMFLLCLGAFLFLLHSNPKYKKFYRTLTPGNVRKMLVHKEDSPALRLYFEGKTLAAAGRTDEALDKFYQAVKKNPKLGKAYLMIGTCFAQKKETAKAVEAFNRAIMADIDPVNKAVAHYNLGAIYLEQQDNFSRAEEHFKKSLEIAPDLRHEGMDPYIGLVKLYTLAGEYEKASQIAQKAYERHPEDAELFAALTSVAIMAQDAVMLKDFVCANFEGIKGLDEKLFAALSKTCLDPQLQKLYEEAKKAREERKKNQPASEAKKAAPVSKERKVYQDTNYGFEITGPEGWQEEFGPGGEEGLVSFYIKKSEKGPEFPFFGVTVDIPHQDFKSAFEFMQFVIDSSKESMKKRGAGLRAVEGPQEVEMAGLKAARRIFDIVAPTGRYIRILDYKFKRDNMMFSVQAMDFPMTFTENLPLFEQAAKSFKFIKGSARPVFSDADFGFSISGPAGWNMEGPGSKRVNSFTERVLFSKHSFGGEDNFFIVVRMEELRPLDQGKSSVEMLNAQLKNMEAAKDKYGLSIQEEPIELKANGLSGGRLRYSVKGGGREQRFIITNFIHRDHIFIIIGNGSDKTFPENVAAYEECVKGFKLNEPQVYIVRAQENLEGLNALAKENPVFVKADIAGYEKLRDEVVKAVSAVRTFSLLHLVKDFAYTELKDDDYVTFNFWIWLRSSNAFEIHRWFVAGKPGGTGKEIMRPADTERIIGDRKYNWLVDWIDVSQIESQAAEAEETKDDNFAKEAYDFKKESKKIILRYKRMFVWQFLKLLKEKDPAGIYDGNPDYTVLKFSQEKKSEEGKAPLWQDTLVWITKKDKLIRYVSEQFREFIDGKPGKEVSRKEYYYGNFNFPYIIDQPKPRVFK